MSEIIKSSSGLMFSEDFGSDISLLWDISPNEQDRVVQNSDSISLLHNSGRTKMLIPIPTDNNYVMQSKINFEPISENDKAGLTIDSLTDIHVDFEVCGDDTTNANYMKMCVDEYGILSAYASSDGERWTNYGNTKINNMNSIGFYNESSDADMSIYNCIMYKNNYITINGFDRKNYIKVFDKGGNEITDDFFIRKYNSRIVIDGIYRIFPIDELTVNIYRIIDDELLSSNVLSNIYGGDIYEFKYDLEVKVNNATIDNNNELYDLGEIATDTIFELTITNKELFDMVGKTVRVSYYSFLNKAYKLVKIAPQNSDTFVDKIEGVDIKSGYSATFKLKITKNAIYSEIEENCKFSIIVD